MGYLLLLAVCHRYIPCKADIVDSKYVSLMVSWQGWGACAPAASYVFLLEPSLNVAVEQQALARVHRFGQTRPVRIVRFISRDTVEVCRPCL